MKKLLLRAVAIVGVVAVVLALALPVRAEEKAKDKKFSCAIVTVDAKAGTLTARRISAVSKVSKTFKVTDQTKCTPALAELKGGDKVTISYTEDGGTLTATCIEAQKK